MSPPIPYYGSFHFLSGPPRVENKNVRLKKYPGYSLEGDFINRKGSNRRRLSKRPSALPRSERGRWKAMGTRKQSRTSTRPDGLGSPGLLKSDSNPRTPAAHRPEPTARPSECCSFSYCLEKKVTATPRVGISTVVVLRQPRPERVAAASLRHVP